MIDFRMLSKAGTEGKMLSKEEIEHLMALFGTFPPDNESEPFFLQFPEVELIWENGCSVDLALRLTKIDDMLSQTPGHAKAMKTPLKLRHQLR